MAHDDFDVIAYKLLAYVYGCMKSNKTVDIDRAWELCGCPPEDYWKAILASLQSDGYITVQDPRYDILGNVMAPGSCAITMTGALYVRDNSAMKKAQRFAGFDYQSEWHCSKTTRARSGTSAGLITSRNGTAPKL